VIVILLLIIGMAARTGDGRSDQPCEPDRREIDRGGLFDDAEAEFRDSFDGRDSCE